MGATLCRNYRASRSWCTSVAPSTRVGVLDSAAPLGRRRHNSRFVTRYLICKMHHCIESSIKVHHCTATYSTAALHRRTAAYSIAASHALQIAHSTATPPYGTSSSHTSHTSHMLAHCPWHTACAGALLLAVGSSLHAPPSRHARRTAGRALMWGRGSALQSAQRGAVWRVVC